jgi:putative zinc finger/helix-turn-helix YgiT family protein
MNEIGYGMKSDTPCCPMCEAHNVVTQFEKENFEYGVGKEATILSIYIPVNKCQSCDYEFVSEKADEIRHDEICNHLRLLTPGKIQEIRIRLGGSQRGFSELTHLGQASIQRWEKRQVLQSVSNDIYLRLLEFPENQERLTRWNRGEKMGCQSASKPSAFKGQALGAEEVKNLTPVSQNFLLRKNG